MDPWATPSPWADDSAAAASTSAAPPSPQVKVRPASPVQAVALDAVALDPWAHSTDDSTIAAASAAPPTAIRSTSPEPRLPASPPLLPASSSEPAPWVDDGPSAWGGAPPEPFPIAAPAKDDESEEEAESQAQRPASPWGGAEVLPPPAASSSWSPAAQEEEQKVEPASATSGWGGESADPWAPPGQSQPKWPGAQDDEDDEKRRRSDVEEEEQSSADIAVRDLDAEFAAQASITPAEAEKPVTTGSRVAAVLSSWRRPAGTSSIEATKPTPAAAAAAAAVAAEKEVTAEAPGAKPSPGWAHVPKKTESGLAAKLSGLWSGAAGAAPTSSIVAAPRVVSAAEEDEEEEVAPRASTSAARSSVVTDLFGESAEAKPASAASQAPAGLAKWLRWGRKQGAPPPEGMSADDLAWLESLPNASNAGGSAAGAAGGADDLEQWLSSNVSSKASAPQAADAPPVPVWARGMQAQGQRPRVDSTPRGVRAQLSSSRGNSPAQGQPPRLAAPPIAPPRRAGTAGGLLDFDDFEEAPTRAAAGKPNPLSPHMAAGAAGGGSRIFSGSSATTSNTADSGDAFGDFESWEPQPTAGALGLSAAATGAGKRASLAPSPASPMRATVGSGLGRGRYAQRNPNLAGGRNPTAMSMDYSTDEEDESIYGRTSPARTRANVSGAYSDQPHDAAAYDEDEPTSADSSWNWGKYTDQTSLSLKSPDAPSPPPKSAGRNYALPREALIAPAPSVAAARTNLDAAFAKASNTPPAPIRALSPQFAAAGSASRTSTPPILPPPPSGARGPLLPPPPGTRSSVLLQPAAPIVAASAAPAFSAAPAVVQKPALSNGPGLTSDDLSFFDSLG